MIMLLTEFHNISKSWSKVDHRIFYEFKINKDNNSQLMETEEDEDDGDDPEEASDPEGDDGEIIFVFWS